jgi:hypothetical protein
VPTGRFLASYTANLYLRILSGGSGVTIIFGGGSKSKNPDGLWVPYFCTGCRDLQPFLVMENYKYGHVYGIRIAKYKSNYFIVCSTCQRALSVPDKEGFQFAQAVARQIKTSTDPDIPMVRLMVDVARFTMKDPEAAATMERLFLSSTEPEPVPSSPSSSQPAAAPSSPAVAASSAQPWYAEHQTAAVEEKVCPDCAESVKAAARKCRFCGYQFSPV